MNPRIALTLLILGIAALIGGIATTGANDRAPKASGAPAFPGVAAKLATAARVEIAGNAKSVTLVRHGDSWGVAERDDYPALASKLRALFAGLGELKLIEPRTADPSLWGRLGVDDPATAGSTAVSLTVRDAQGAVLAQTLIGHRSLRTAGGLPDSIYLRRPDDRSAWRAEGHVEADADPLSWLARDLLDVKSDSIAKVEITRGDTTFTLSRKADALALDNPPEDAKIDDIRLIEVAQALENFSLADVRKGPAPGTPVGQAVFTTKDGQSITVQVTQQDKLVWATIAVTGPGAEKYTSLSGWAFELPDWRLGTLVPTPDDFIKKDARN